MSKSNGKVMQFFKQNLAYFVLAFCILAIGLSVLFVMVGEQKVVPTSQTEIVKPTDDDPTENPDEEKTTVTFIIPVQDYTSYTDYCETMVFNSTLNRYSSHLAIDFYGNEGTNVYAVSDGQVESVTTSLLTGTTVVINHGNGLKTVYNSLLDGEEVIEGQTVKQGDIIGKMSTSNRQEYKSGAHLHFQTMENDKIIDPSKYLTIDLK